VGLGETIRMYCRYTEFGEGDADKWRGDNKDVDGEGDADGFRTDLLYRLGDRV
jgi:hypothetical protein